MSVQNPDSMDIGEDLFSDCYNGPNSIAHEQKEQLFETSDSPASKPKMFPENQGSPSSEHREFLEKSGSEMKDLEKQSSISFEQKEQFLENIFDENNDHTAGNNDHTAGNNDHTDGRTEGNFLPPVPPGGSGEGLPYAPVDWPNPGDIWSWRVGKRINSSGFYIDRSLYLPKSLHKPKCQKQIFSRHSLEHFLRAQFPGADIDALLNSFSWKVPASVEHQKKVEVMDHPQGVPPEVGEDDAKKESTEKTLRASNRKRKQPEFLGSVPREPKTKPIAASANKSTTKSATRSEKSNHKPVTESRTPKRQTRQRTMPSASSKTDGEADMPFHDGEAENSVGGNQDLGLHIYISPQNGVITCHSPVELVAEDFDNYLSSLDDILDQPISGDQSLELVESNSLPAEDESEARAELSSLLNMGIPSLICLKDLSKLTSLASKLRKDPILTAEQLVMLKLLEEIPSFSEAFIKNKEIVDKADNFFQTLETNKAKIASLRKEYSDLKDQTVQVQSEVDDSILSVKEIDEQIAQLEARRVDLTKLIETQKKEQSELAYNQKLVGNTIPKVVNEVQIANSKKPELELKKEGAVKREAEILSRFAPLGGLSL